MDIVLHLNGHCIETAAKRKYEELVSELLKEDNPEKEKQLELLVEFLEKADFRELRKKGFDGSKKMKVVIRKVGEEFIVEEL